MKWVAVASFFVCFATLSRGSASSCEPGSEDARCLSENTEKVPNSTESSSIVRERKKEGWAECLAGSEWESKCHKCRCSEDGHAECTRMEVCAKGDYGDPIRCKPRTSFKVDCNTCSCTETGQTACTLIGCLSGLPLLPTLPDLEARPELPALSDLPARPDLPARTELPGVREFPALRELPALPDLPARPELPALPASNTTQLVWTGKRKMCLPGSTWKSRCNSCFCTEDGLPACTEMACMDREEEPERSCAPGSRWKNDCNRCWCDSGYAACTRMGCDIAIITNFNPVGAPSSSEQVQPENQLSVSRKIRATAQGTPKTCQPGTEFRMDCNKCLCDNEGQDYSCTRIDCAALNGNGNGAVRRKRATAQVQTQCVPESVFNQDCNVCRCEADGNHATCSIKRCKEDNPDEDDSSDSDLSFRCNPGEQFKRGCNDCTCSADGKSVFCTIRLCDQDITPTI